MVMAGDFRKGTTVEIDGNVWSVVDFQHVKPGKGAAFVRTRLKNAMTGAVLERTFSPTDKYPEARIETKEMTYSYSDGELYYFMDNETYDQIPLNHEQVEDAIDFIKERGGKDITFMCLIAAPEGIKVLQEAHPDVDIYIAATDRCLNENAYIVPGLGDAGDRIFGTK